MKLVSCAAVLGLTLAGCGGENEPSLGAKPEKTTLVAALGDSITEGAPLATRESRYGHWAEMRLKGTRFRHCGVSGERTDQIAARLDRCAERAKVLIVQGGINDIAQGRPVEEAARDLRSMVERGMDLGLRVALTEVLPWNNGYPAAARPIRRLNRAIAQIGSDLRVPVLPWYSKLEDPANPGRMKPEWTTDGDHPSVTGYRRLGEAVTLP